MAAKVNGGGVVAEINVTPFVDIVLVLLIIFMVTSSQLSAGVMELDLPQASEVEAKPAEVVQLVVNEGGALTFGDERVSADQLADRLAELSARPHPPSVVVAADRGTTYQALVQALDAIKAAEVSSFALELEPLGPRKVQP
ncbi:MAG: biopolymer transporter ExbD [Myxococcota bacterium]